MISRAAWRILFAVGIACTAGAQRKPMPLEEFVRLADSLPLPPAGSPRTLAPPDATRDGLLPVVVHAAGLPQVQAAGNAIRAAGGEVTAVFETAIWARIAPGALERLTAAPGVRSVSPDPTESLVPEPEPAPGMVGRTTAAPGDGVRAAHLEQMHARGVTGKGVRIGILDRGFSGYARLLREGRVTQALGERAFPAVHGIENGEIHGAACAEVISVAAPGAQLYLASFDGTPGQFVQAAQWLISMNVAVINYSLGNAASPNDGTDDISRFVDQTTRRRGVLWVVASGNHAEQHWTGDVEQTAADAALRFAPLATKGLGIQALGTRLRIVVRSTRPIDAFLYALNDGGVLYEVARSGIGRPADASLAVKTMELRDPGLAGRQYFLVLRASPLKGRWRVHVFLEPGGAARLYPATAAGSVLTPASARLALAVGAVDVLTGELSRYSSQGPTDDNRLKPEVSAPANTVSWAYSGRFTGTSSACAHVAAYAALLKQENPGASAIELRALVLQSVAPKGTPLPNSLFGYGQIDANAVRPRNRDLKVEALDGVVELPPDYGGSITFSALAALRARAGQSFDTSGVLVFAEQEAYHVGDALHVGIAATGDCECLLFVRDANGKYSLLAAPRLRPEETRMLPEATEEDWRIGGPPGTDELLLVCARQRRAITLSDGVGVAMDSYLILKRMD